MTDTEVSVKSPQEMMPGRRGGMLRRGGGRPPLSEHQVKVIDILKAAAPDAAQAMWDKAKKGDVRAAEIVLQYVVGKPTDKVELSGPDGGPLEFSEARTDHERRLLRDAITRELARAEELVEA